MIQVREEFCPQNHPCPVVNVCPVGAISQATPYSPPMVDEELCTDCGACTNACSVFQAHAA